MILIIIKLMKKLAQIILYTKPGCHLCEQARQQILAAGCAELYTLEEVNIESDPFLFACYSLDIPVITINGKEAFRHRLTSDQFKRALTGSGKDV